jgi:hypothetical protein
MRNVLNALLLLVVVLVIAWTGLWWYAQGRMQEGLTAWVAEVSQNASLKASYASVTRGTNPLAATVTLTNLQFTLQPGANTPPVTVTLPSVTERINAGNPLLAHIDLPAQINFSTARGDASVTFGTIDFAEHLDPRALFDKTVQPFSGSDITATDINLLASGGSLQVLHIDSLDDHGVVNANAGAGQAALTGGFTFKCIALSPLLTRIASVPFGGKITELGFTTTISGPVPANWRDLANQINALPVDDKTGQAKLTFTALHGWAAAGGNAKFGITLQVGPSTLSADTAVAFDANVQPSGTANVTADHLDAFSATITSAYPQVQDNVNQIEAQLSPYLSTTNDGGQVLTVHLVYGSGAVSINGQKVSDMPPMDWNLLENPPAPASGDGSGAQQ